MGDLKHTDLDVSSFPDTRKSSPGSQIYCAKTQYAQFEIGVQYLSGSHYHSSEVASLRGGLATDGKMQQTISQIRALQSEFSRALSSSLYHLTNQQLRPRVPRSSLVPMHLIKNMRRRVEDGISPSLVLLLLPLAFLGMYRSKNL